MPFTDRFIKIPIEIVDSKNSDMGMDNEVLFEDYIMVNPMEIMAYRKHFSGKDVAEYDNKTVIEFKNNRDNMIALLTIEDFEKLLNDHS